VARERDVSVLLVDADAPRAHVSELFDIRWEPGLIDALTRESSTSNALSRIRTFAVSRSSRPGGSSKMLQNCSLAPA
jgi:hypothetical protein